MIAILSCILVMGVFIAGHLLITDVVGAWVLAGACCICLGVLIAVAETHGFEGQRVLAKTTPLTWDQLWGRVIRFGLDRDRAVGAERLYVQTPQGPKPLTSVFLARIDHTPSIVFDVADDAAHAETFNALKQGVM